jgi:hypothetical protein
LRDWRGKWGNGPFIDPNNLTNPIDEFKENRYLRVQARFTPSPRAGTSRCERLTGVATRDMVCSFFFEIEPCLEMDYIRDPLRRLSKPVIRAEVPTFFRITFYFRVIEQIIKKAEVE